MRGKNEEDKCKYIMLHVQFPYPVKEACGNSESLSHIYSADRDG